MRPKVSVIGAGNVGATLTQRLAERDIADLVLVDIVEGLAEGKALDLLEAGPIIGHNSRVVGGTDYALTAGSQVVVITSGLARKPGMSRDDLVRTNAGIVGEVTRAVVAGSPDAVLIMVTNPLDAMVHQALRVSGLPRERVVGMAGVLDTARFRCFVAQELEVAAENVQAHVLGGHGDTMVPLIGMTTVAGVPISRLLGRDRVEAIVARTRDGGAEIVRYLKTGSAFYAPSAATAQMVEAILLDSHVILPCAVELRGEYGLNGVVMGVPAQLHAGGLERVVEMELAPDERLALERSAEAVRQLLTVLG